MDLHKHTMFRQSLSPITRSVGGPSVITRSIRLTPIRQMSTKPSFPRPTSIQPSFIRPFPTSIPILATSIRHYASPPKRASDNVGQNSETLKPAPGTGNTNHGTKEDIKKDTPEGVKMMEQNGKGGVHVDHQNVTSSAQAEVSIVRRLCSVARGSSGSGHLSFASLYCKDMHQARFSTSSRIAPILTLSFPFLFPPSPPPLSPFPPIHSSKMSPKISLKSSPADPSGPPV